MNGNDWKKDPASAPTWYDALRRPPDDRGFTPELARRTRERAERLAQGRRRTGSGVRRTVGAATLVAAALAAAGVWWLAPGALPFEPQAAPETDVRAEISARLEALPGGDLAAGAPAGVWWNLRGTPEELLGHSIEIIGTHDATGVGVRELPPTTLTSEHVYEGELVRVSSRLAVPLPGRWTFRAFLDGEALGIAAIDVPEGSWEPSGSFRSGEYAMTGVPNLLAFLGPEFVAGKPNKYMWHFWGEPEALTGSLVLLAVRQGSTELVRLFQGRLAPGALNGADASRPSGLTLPSAGRWRIAAFVDGAMHGSVVVDVKPLTESP